MKRWELSEPGIDAMRLVDAARPEPLPGEVLVKVGIPFTRSIRFAVQ
ncbi:MAG: hypothetical protein ACTHLW_10950 [Verrucomicrobiota bacterium]